MREEAGRACLVIWGKYDLSFDLGEPERYRKDVPKAQVHVLDGRSFSRWIPLQMKIAALIRGFC